MIKDPRIEPMANVLAEVTGEPRAGRFEHTMATAALAALDKASTITTVEELDALPVGSVVLSDGYRYSLTHPNYKVSFQRLYDGEWHRGCRASNTHPENIIPAHIIYFGGTE